MPDGLVRLHHSGQPHFLTFSCYHRRPLLAGLGLQDAFLRALEQVRRRFHMPVYGYVVMPEHVHLLMHEPPSGTIAGLMQSLKSKVAIIARNQLRTSRSPLWQARYFDHNVRNHSGFVTQLRYIHRNPVKRGLCRTPQDWPWSSFRAWATGERGPVEIENQWTAQRRATNPVTPPPSAPTILPFETEP